MIKLHVWWINVLQRWLDKRAEEKPYLGYNFVRYDTVDGSPLYNFNHMVADRKFIDWCYGAAPPPGKGSHYGMHVDDWFWNAFDEEWVRE